MKSRDTKNNQLDCHWSTKWSRAKANKVLPREHTGHSKHPIPKTQEITLASLVAQRLKHLPATLETQVRSLGREDPLEKEMATHSSIFAWIIPWMEKPCRLQSTGSQRVGHDWATSLSLSGDNSTRAHHQMVTRANKIRLIIFFAAKDGWALYSQ